VYHGQGLSKAPISGTARRATARGKNTICRTKDAKGVAHVVFCAGARRWGREDPEPPEIGSACKEKAATAHMAIINHYFCYVGTIAVNAIIMIICCLNQHV